MRKLIKQLSALSNEQKDFCQCRSEKTTKKLEEQMTLQSRMEKTGYWQANQTIKQDLLASK